MATHTESYSTLPSARQSKMKIDALLNPGDGEISPRTQHASIPPPSHRHSYHQQPSPSFPPSPNYWYNRSYHDTSPGALSSTTTATTQSNSTNASHHSVNPSQSHQMFFTYRPLPSPRALLKRLELVLDQRRPSSSSPSKVRGRGNVLYLVPPRWSVSGVEGGPRGFQSSVPGPSETWLPGYPVQVLSLH